MTCLCSGPTSVQIALPDQLCLVLFSCKNQWEHRKANGDHTQSVLLKNQSLLLSPLELSEADFG